MFADGMMLVEFSEECVLPQIHRGADESHTGAQITSGSGSYLRL